MSSFVACLNCRLLHVRIDPDVRIKPDFYLRRYFKMLFCFPLIQAEIQRKLIKNDNGNKSNGTTQIN